MWTSLGDRWVFGLGLGEGIGALATTFPMTLGDRLSCSSALTWSFAGYSLTQPILGPTPVVHFLDNGLLSFCFEVSTLVPEWPLLSWLQFLGVAESLELALLSFSDSNCSSSSTGFEGGISSSIGYFCSRKPRNHKRSSLIQQFDASKTQVIKD